MSPRTDRRSRQGLESRQRIIDATFAIANELGYQGTSIAKVSARSGLPASSVYWHFADKDELFAEMLQSSFDQWNEAMPSWDSSPVSASDVPSRHEVVTHQLRSAVASISTSPEFWRLGLMLALERQAIEPVARKRFVEIRRSVLETLAAFWASALPPRVIERSPGLPELLARFTMATTDGIFISAQVDSPYELSMLADLLADSLEAAAARMV